MYSADIRLVDALPYDDQWVYNDTCQIGSTTFGENLVESFKSWLFDNVRSVAEAVVLGVFGIEEDDNFLEVVDLELGKPLMCAIVGGDDEWK